jgi:hypothetical protein
MNAIAKTFAAATLAVAALGAHASEITPGDFGAQPVKAAPAVAVQAVKPVGIDGEVTAGDLGARKLGALDTPARAASAEANPVPVYARFLIVG